MNNDPRRSRRIRGDSPVYYALIRPRVSAARDEIRTPERGAARERIEERGETREHGSEIEINPVVTMSERGSPVFRRESTSSERESQGRPRTQSCNLTPPTFSGSPGEDVNAFLSKFNRIAAANAWDEETKIRLMPCFLTGTAGRWLNAFADYDPENGTIEGNWHEFCRSIKTAFRGAWATELKECELRERKQGPNEPIDDYFYDVRALCREVNPEMNDLEIVRQLIKGLRPELVRVVVPSRPETPAQVLGCLKAYEEADFIAQVNARTPSHLLGGKLTLEGKRDESESIRNLEKEIRDLKRVLEQRTFGNDSREDRRGAKERRPHTPGGRQGAPRRQEGRSRFWGSSRTSEGKPICFCCRAVGHVAAVCPMNDSGGTRCFQCQGRGHRAAECPTRRRDQPQRNRAKNEHPQAR
jgi:hypothetical protein